MYHSDSVPSSSEKHLLEIERHLLDKQSKRNMKYFHFKHLSERHRALLNTKVCSCTADRPHTRHLFAEGDAAAPVARAPWDQWTVHGRNVTFNLPSPWSLCPGMVIIYLHKGRQCSHSMTST